MSSKYKKLIKKAAKQYGVSIAEVEHEMNCIPKEDDIPTAKDVIEYTANRAKIIKQ